MARRGVDIHLELPHHVTARCINKEWFEIPLPEVWEIMENYLYFIHHAFSVTIHSFVLMPNHFHLLISAPKQNLSGTMNYFMRETSRSIGRRAGRINQVYGARFGRSLINSNHYYSHAYKYIYRNPVRWGLVDRTEDYRHSTLHGLIGGGRLIIPVANDTLLFSPYLCMETLEWLNSAPETKNELSVRKALRKKIFALAGDRESRRENCLETERL